VFGAATPPSRSRPAGRAARRRADRGSALRFGALMHDIAKPVTRTVAADGRVGFPHHDALGARISRVDPRRLRAAERVQSYVAALTRTTCGSASSCTAGRSRAPTSTATSTPAARLRPT
jgi:hypothetical protein